MENCHCPVCHGQNIEYYSEFKERKYYQCQECELVFLKNEDLLPPDIEVERYSHHENNPEDMNYRKFLSRLLDPMAKYIEGLKTGLDFGCGPGPTISVMLNEKGFDVSNYDLYFCKDEEALTKKYDFLTCTEVIEHMYEPAKEFELMLSLVNEKGVLGIMTQFLKPKEEFHKWWYIKDDTHVRFFSPKTFTWMANKYNLDVNFYGESIAIFTKR